MELRESLCMFDNTRNDTTDNNNNSTIFMNFTH